MRLSIPACLSVTLLGCADRVDPGDETGTTTSTGADPTTDPTMNVTTTTPEPSTTSSSSSDESSSTGPFEIPDCAQHAYVAECDNEPGCVWRIDDGGCVIDCPFVPDQATCVGLAYCVWTDACDYPGPI